MFRFFVITSLTLFPSLALCNETSVTIYSTATPGSVSPEMYRPTSTSSGLGWGYNIPIPGYAVVRDVRAMELKTGVNQLNFSDVAAYIDPTTVSIKSLTDPATSVLEQNFLFDLVNTQKLIEKFIGQEITVEQTLGNAVQINVGKLLSASGGLVIQDKSNKVSTITQFANIKFPELPNGLITKPTLLWSISTKKDGKHDIETSYQTAGITWWADYIGTYTEGANANSGFLDLAGWVSIVNKAGTDFTDSKLKLVAGDVHKAQPQTQYGYDRAYKNIEAAAAGGSGFVEKAFFEYHLYTLPRKVNIPDNSTKQLELFSKASKIPVTKEYLYYGANQGYYGYAYLDRGQSESTAKVDVILKFKNSEKEKLGIPLPSGRVRINQLDPADGSMEFIGEDIIDHTPKDELVKIKMGQAFDIIGERKQVDFFVDQNKRIMEESIEITLRNHKKEDIKVSVKENLYRGQNWKISGNSQDFQKENSNTISFSVPVKKEGTAKVQYKVTYSW